MDNKKYNRLVKLLCPTCGNHKLETKEDLKQKIIRCPSCNRAMTEGELIKKNSKNIESNIEEIKEEVFRDFTKEFDKMLKNTFRGSTNIRIK